MKMPMDSKVVAVISGGMDSSTLLYALLEHNRDVRALGFDYGQRHRRELIAAQVICAGRGVPFEVADLTRLSRLIAGQSALVNPDVEVPHGHYEDETMKATVVPNRNMIMLAVAAGHAISLGFDAVAYGAHSGDHAIYPDCRPVFVDAMARALDLCDWKRLKLHVPFLGMTKAQIAASGARLDVPFELTWSCYEGGELHCGECGTCTERIEAFRDAGIDDPTEYANQNEAGPGAA